MLIIKQWMRFKIIHGIHSNDMMLHQHFQSRRMVLWFLILAFLSIAYRCLMFLLGGGMWGGRTTLLEDNTPTDDSIMAYIRQYPRTSSLRTTPRRTALLKGTDFSRAKSQCLSYQVLLISALLIILFIFSFISSFIHSFIHSFLCFN